MSAARPLRADAERNRARILAAAGEVFAERGLDVSLDDIAAHAGVGVATVYRRFPEKDALIDALFEDKIDRAVALADDALELEDPWEGLTAFMRGMCRMQAEDRGFKDALLAGDRGRERVAGARERIAPRAMKLLSRAQEAGAVRADLGPFDVPMLHLCVALIDALFEDKIDRAVALADSALEIEDPWEGFTTFMRGMCRMQAEDRGFKDALLGGVRGRDRVAAARERISPRAMKLLARAQEAGAIRSDLGPFDVPMLNLCVGLIADRTRDVAPDYWQRVLTIVIDGISTNRATTPMPVEPLDHEAFTEAMASARRQRS